MVRNLKTLVGKDVEFILETLNATAWQVSEKIGGENILEPKPTTLEGRMKGLGIKCPLRGPDL